MIKTKLDLSRMSKERPLPTPNLPRGKDGDGPHYSTWLLIRSNAGDTGSRPLLPGSVFWESPDVWTVGSLGVNRPVVNETTQVFARVTNRGMAPATPVTIKYWWADPSVAITQDPTKLIGEITGALIPANSSLVFQCPSDWVPIEANSGHECIIVEAFIPWFEGLTDPMRPAADRHVGQKNEHLLAILPGQSFQFQLEAHNFANAKRQVAIEAHPGILPRNFNQRFGDPDMWKTGLLDPMFALPLEIKIDSKPMRVSSIVPRLRRQERIGEGASPTSPLARATQSFRPGEVRLVTITGTLPPAAQLGEVHVIRIFQKIGEAIAGGYTLYITQRSQDRTARSSGQFA
jgi:hypothetical protein